MPARLLHHETHTVLVVDDEPHVVEILKGLLGHDGHRVLGATDAEEALDLARRERPCLVLSDVMMPGMTGLELCRRLGADPATAAIPVALVTGKIEDADVAEGLAAGAVDYIKKPFDRAEVRMRVRTQIRLRETLCRNQQVESELTAITESAGDAIILMDDSGAVAHWNPAAERLFGYTKAEALGRNVHQLLAPPRFHAAHHAAYPTFVRTGAGAAVGRTLELVAVRKDGVELPVELTLSSARIEGRWHAVGIIRDLTERKAADARYKALFDGSIDAIMTLAPPTWRFSSGNPAAIRMFAVRDEVELVSRAPWEYSPERQRDGRRSDEMARERIEAALREGTLTFEWTHRRLTGEVFPAVVQLVRVELGGETQIQATVRDETERKRMEAELGQARKLEAVGQLAAGIAHEINTPAQFVGDSLHFLRSSAHDVFRLVDAYRGAIDTLERAGGHEALVAELRSAEDEADLEYISEHVPRSFDRCFEGVSRIASIVGAMKEFAHPDQREKQPADLNQALRTTLVIAHNEYKYVADVETDFGELPPVLCHLGALNQVFLNLIVNAAHAIGDVVGDAGARGRITVRTAAEGDHVRLEIGDTGCGIPEEIRDRIYDPFFTTKPVGKGSGQGLAIARSIVVGKHGGTLACESAVGAGTTFTIRLPVGDGA